MAPTAAAGAQGGGDAAAIQTAWASSAVRTTNAAAELRKLMSTAKQLGRTANNASAPPASPPAASVSMASMPCMVGGMGTAGFGGGANAAAVAAAHAAASATNQQQQSYELQSLAAAAHLQTAQMQQLAQGEEMQRMQIAMQMQMSVQNELQNREEKMKRDRPPSPARDPINMTRKQRRGEKDSSEFFYDAAKAKELDQDESCVGTSDLVKKVKIIQRSSARGYNAWDSYCLSKGNKTKDPRLHHDDFLQGFFDAISKGEFGDVPGAVAILGDTATRRFVPESQGDGDGTERPYPKAVFIAGLPKHTTEQELQEHFATFGPVQAVRLKFDADMTFRGIGEVEFQDEASAKKVLDNFDYNIYQGRWINCMIAKRKGILGRNPKWWSGTGREQAA